MQTAQLIKDDLVGSKNMLKKGHTITYNIILEEPHLWWWIRANPHSNKVKYPHQYMTSCCTGIIDYNAILILAINI